jgi:hypothetical protein
MYNTIPTHFYHYEDLLNMINKNNSIQHKILQSNKNKKECTRFLSIIEMKGRPRKLNNKKTSEIVQTRQFMDTSDHWLFFPL